MSKHNKANRNNYTQAGRLTPDEMGRELRRPRESATARPARERVTAKARSGGRAPTRPRTAREG
jgi:hypothetical protein